MEEEDCIEHMDHRGQATRAESSGDDDEALQVLDRHTAVLIKGNHRTKPTLIGQVGRTR